MSNKSSSLSQISVTVEMCTSSTPRVSGISHGPQDAATAVSSRQYAALPLMVLRLEGSERYTHKLGRLHTERLGLSTIYKPPIPDASSVPLIVKGSINCKLLISFNCALSSI